MAKKAKQKKAPAKVQAVVEKKPAPPPVIEVTDEVKAFRQTLYLQGQTYWDDQAEKYGWDDPEQPQNVVARLQAVLGAPDQIAATQALQKAKATIQVMILGAWARGRIPGPTTEQSVEKRVKRAESLALMLEKKGQDEAARRQWDRASKLREQLEEIREDSKI